MSNIGTDQWFKAVNDLLGSLDVDNTCGNTGDEETPSRMVTGNVDDWVLDTLGISYEKEV